MSENKYQATVVGTDAIPRSRRERKWQFLDLMIGSLSLGQAIRLVLPKEQSIGGLQSKWLRLTRKKGIKSHNRVAKQIDGSKIVYLWYDDQQ